MTSQNSNFKLQFYEWGCIPEIQQEQRVLNASVWLQVQGCDTDLEASSARYF